MGKIKYVISGVWLQGGTFDTTRREVPPNDPSSPTPAQAAASPQPEGEKGVRCSTWLGDEETKLRNSIDQYMAEYIKRNLQSPQ